MSIDPEICGCCGASGFVHEDVLWPELIAEWELTPAETQAVNRQQGTRCIGCGANLRSMALAHAIARGLRRPGAFAAVATDLALCGMDVLEINRAGNLTAYLERIPGYVGARFPDVDMQALPYADRAFDLVVHSDTLEHVEDPASGLRECRRVLRPGGLLAFSVPVLSGRQTRSRRGLPSSFHLGEQPGERSLVWSEFGADVWALVLAAGFDECRFIAYHHPEALALIATAPPPPAVPAPPAPARDPDAGVRVRSRRWFYRIELPDGTTTDSYVGPEGLLIHETRARMLDRALTATFGAERGALRALDIGCHEGFFSVHLRRRGVGRVLGVDPRATHVQHARDLAEVLGLEGVSFRVGHVETLDPETLGAFDVVLMFGLLYHVTDPVGALRRARSLTRRLCLIETQLATQSARPVEWGSRLDLKPVLGTLSLVDETRELADGNPESGLDRISLVADRDALLAMMRLAGFERVEVLTPPAGAHEQLARGARVIVAGFVGTDERQLAPAPSSPPARAAVARTPPARAPSRPRARDYLRAACYAGSDWPGNFWSADWSGLERDLVHVREDGFNSILVPVPWAGFQPSTAIPVLRESSCQRLAMLLDAARAADLGVVLRVGYLWSMSPDDACPDRAIRVFHDAGVHQAWLAYLARLRALCHEHASFRFALISWEDFWEVTHLCRLEADDRARFGARLNFRGGEPLPRTDEPGFRDLLAHFDRALVERLLVPGRERFPELSLEVRTDHDPLRRADGTREWFVHDPFIDPGAPACLAAYFNVEMGQANLRDRVPAAAVIPHLSKLVEQLGAGPHPVFLGQLTLAHDTPGFDSTTRLQEGEEEAFLQGIVEPLVEHTAGYGLWMYRDVAFNLLHNPDFAIGLEGWTLAGAGRPTRHDEARALVLEPAGSARQDVSPALHRRVVQKAIAGELSCRVRAARGGARVRLRVGSRIVAEASVGAAEVTLSGSYGEEDAADLSFAVEAVEGSIVVRACRLHPWVLRGSIYDVDGAPLPGREPIRRFNAALAAAWARRRGSGLA